MKSYSIIRKHEYKKLKTVVMNGSILDLGGSKKSGYHDLIKGVHTWTVVNYGDTHPGMDLSFNIKEKFPLEDNSFNNVVTMNVFSEVARVIRRDGLFVSTVPFMHHVHGSPDDYHSYTESTFRKLADKYGFEIIRIEPLGYGLFSLIFLDKVLLNFNLYRKFQNKIPLGYFWIMKKK